MLIIKKQFPAEVHRASVNGKEIYLIVFPKDARYLGLDFRPIGLTEDERREVCRKLGELRRRIKRAMLDPEHEGQIPCCGDSGINPGVGLAMSAR